MTGDSRDGPEGSRQSPLTTRSSQPPAGRCGRWMATGCQVVLSRRLVGRPSHRKWHSAIDKVGCQTRRDQASAPLARCLSWGSLALVGRPWHRTENVSSILIGEVDFFKNLLEEGRIDLPILIGWTNAGRLLSLSVSCITPRLMTAGTEHISLRPSRSHHLWSPRERNFTPGF